MRQEISFYDDKQAASAGTLSTRLTADVELVQKAVSEKLTGVAQSIGMMVSGIVIAFVQGAQLAGVVLAALPAIMIIGGLFSMVSQRFSSAGAKAYERAGQVADEVLVGMRTVAVCILSFPCLIFSPPLFFSSLP